MKKKNKIQANYRLPAALVEDLKEVSEKTGYPQTLIAIEGIRMRVKTLKARIRREQEPLVTA